MSQDIFNNKNLKYSEFANKCELQKDNKQEIEQSSQQNNSQQEGLYYDYHTICKKNYDEQELIAQPKHKYVWCHISCILYVPECFFENKYFVNNIKGLDKIDQLRFELECAICKQKNSGSCIQCQKNNCIYSFHPECARIQNIHLEIQNNEKQQYIIYCDYHKPLQIIKTLDYKEKNTKFFTKKNNQNENIIYLKKINQKIQQQQQNNEIDIETITQKDEQIQQNNNNNNNQSLQYQVIHFPGQEFLKHFKTIINQIEFSKIIKCESPDTKLELYKKYINIQKSKNQKKNFEQILQKRFRKSKYFKLRQLKKNEIEQQLFKLNENNNKFDIKNLSKKYIKKANKISKDKNKKKKLKLNTKKIGKVKKQIEKIKETEEKYAENYESVNEDSDQLYCICRQKYTYGDQMMACEICNEWFHFKCLGYKGSIEEAEKIQFICTLCYNKQDQIQQMKIFNEYKDSFENYKKYITNSINGEQEKLYQIDDQKENNQLQANTDSFKANKNNQKYVIFYCIYNILFFLFIKEINCQINVKFKSYINQENINVN
ncbi:PHD-finger family protein, putative [Ichthyophthirius multifiliis]|uniref:PHD-finger family protein, putative n=1 Tax=Ichthyophthirius multifiliis TaxID=5932 RepID=G0R699_ICHMU|nr:PHD-finger family protein, putative [Ichthyophthirius multifiliis]EGR27007.1 PHD-finger family protein, putative [Ichthyophthirius multifiliis]|eukprot:XP_004023891.1 PHD-finger family protein, putative [Ichthyophthirius multifiliis]